MPSVASSKTAQDSSLTVVATDGELLMRFDRHRDQAAFAEVVERHGRLVWIVCKQALRHHQDVEDAFQATFLILAQRATTIRASDSAAAWLYRVAQRTAIAARRRRSRLREETLTAEPPQGEEALPLIHDRQMMRVLMEELQSLPKRYQMPLVMQYFEGQSRRAIAEQTDSTLAQIQGRLVRGKRMLRSRLMRRGVSLSLATGAIATASSAASAAVSPSLVAATAASSSSIIASGATGSASPAAVELSKQGLNAMWYASLTKIVGTAAGVLMVAGVLFAAQSGDDGLANVTIGQAANGVDLQATVAAVAEEDEPAAIAVAAAEPAKAGVKPAEDRHRWTQRQRQIVLERDHWMLKAKAYRMKAKQIRDLRSAGKEPPITETDAMLLEAEANMAEVKAIELAAQIGEATADPNQVDDQQQERLAKQRDENERKITQLRELLAETSTVYGETEIERERSEQALLQRELEQLHAEYLQLNSPLATVPGAGENNLQVQGEALEKLKNEVQKRIDETKARLEARRERIARIVRGIEKDQRERAGIERKLDFLEKANLQFEFPQESLGATSSNSIDSTDSRVVLLENERRELVNQVGRLQTMVEKMKEQLELQNTQHLDEFMKRSELERQIQQLQQNPSLTFANDQSSDPRKTTVAPGDTIHIEALQVEPEVPITDDYQVEAAGTVALGATYGRVKVEGLTILDAQEAIRKHLAEKFENPMVQVTMGNKAASDPFGQPPPTAATREVVASRELFQAINTLRQENAALKQQIEELRKAQPSEVK